MNDIDNNNIDSGDNKNKQFGPNGIDDPRMHKFGPNPHSNGAKNNSMLYLNVFK